MKVTFEDIHGNQVEEEITLSDGDRLIVRVKEDRRQEEISDVLERLRKFLRSAPGTMVVVPYWIEFVVMKVQP